MWDLMDILQEKEGVEQGYISTQNIFTGLLKGGPDIAASFDEALVADDDDGDLENGTPHECEIIDAYGRPIFYDKVKTSDPTGIYWNPALFQAPTGASLSNGRGHYVHPDREYFDNGLLALMPESEPEGYADMDEAALLPLRMSPRFKSDSTRYTGAGGIQAYLEGLFAAGDPPVGGHKDDLEPQFDGGYDLWSTGRSWVDPRDDITSWGQ